jgi:hypothetical protein
VFLQRVEQIGVQRDRSTFTFVFARRSQYHGGTLGSRQGYGGAAYWFEVRK